MNERIRELAREAAGGLLSYNSEGEFYLSEKEVEKFAELIIAAEREACALVCEQVTAAWSEIEYNEACIDCAKAIRARGEV